MFFEFDHNGNGIFYNVIFREEGIMNIIHYVQGVSSILEPVENSIGQIYNFLLFPVKEHQFGRFSSIHFMGHGFKYKKCNLSTSMKVRME